MQAVIFIAVIQVDRTTLALLIAAAVAGAWFGAGFVSGWQRRRIQLGMGVALFVAAAFIVPRMTHSARGRRRGRAGGLAGCGGMPETPCSAR